MRILVIVNMLLMLFNAAHAGMYLADGRILIAFGHFAVALFCQWNACRVLRGPRLTLPNSFVVSTLVSTTVLASQSITILAQTGQPTLGLLCVMGISILFPIALSEQLRCV